MKKETIMLGILLGMVIGLPMRFMIPPPYGILSAGIVIGLSVFLLHKIEQRRGRIL